MRAVVAVAVPTTAVMHKCIHGSCCSGSAQYGSQGRSACWAVVRVGYSWQKCILGRHGTSACWAMSAIVRFDISTKAIQLPLLKLYLHASFDNPFYSAFLQSISMPRATKTYTKLTFRQARNKPKCSAKMQYKNAV